MEKLAAEASLRKTFGEPAHYVPCGQVLVPVQIAGVALIVLGALGVNLKWSWRQCVPVRA